MKRIHYCWVICAVCTGIQLSVSGLLTNSFTVFYPYIVSQNGFTNSQLSLLIELRTIFAFLSLLGITAYYKKLGYRYGLVLGAVLTGASFFLFANAGSFASYCAAFSLAGVAYTLAGMVPASVLILRWFHDRSGLALGITASGTGIATILLSPLFTKLIISTSIRTGFLVQAFWELAFAAALFFLVRMPEEKGVQPYTYPAAEKKSSLTGTYHISGGRLVVVLAAAVLLGGYVNVGFGYLTTMYTIDGMAPMLIAFGMSIIGAALILGKCMFGEVSDRFGTFKANLTFYGASLAGLALCAFGTGGVWRMYASMTFMGLGFSMVSVALPIWASNLSGRGEYANVLKKLQMSNMAGNLVFNMLPGPIADRFGSYHPVYMLFTVMCLLSAVLIQIIYADRQKRMKAAR